MDKAVSTTGLTATGGKVKGGGPPTYQVRMTATVSLNTGRAAVGTVTFFVGNVATAPVQVGPNGQATATVTVKKGRTQVRAVFTPTDASNHLGSNSPTLTVNVK